MGPMKFCSDSNNFIPIVEFYAGKSIFITGGTGFIGKVIIEKLLYSCEGIEKIYVLLRDKKDLKAEQRIKKLTDSVLFSRIKKKNPQHLDKIIPVIGDIEVPELGLKFEDEQILINKVSVVIHSAATIKFNEPLSIALNTNVEGTKRVLDLCQRMKNIQAFVHISTAFSNTDREVVEEIVYPPPARLGDVYEQLALHGDDDYQTTVILNGRPNTYTFTKSLAETYVEQNRGNIPTALIRPSIVTASSMEPIVGWVDNWNGLTGILVAICKGMLRAIVGSSSNVIDIIPVDHVSNLVITAAARCDRGEMSVYNCCTSHCNPISMKKIYDIFVSESLTHNYGGIPFPMIIFTTYKWIASIVCFIFQTIPAYILDIWLRVRGKRPRYVKFNTKLLTLRKLFDYFTSRTWDLRSHNARALSASLSTLDRRRFPCDPADIIWQEYVLNYCRGVKKYLLCNTNSKSLN